MGFFLLITSFLLFLFSSQKEYRKSLLCVFSFLWFLIISLYEMRLLQLYDIKKITYLVFWVGIVFFPIGYISSKKSGSVSYVYNSEKKQNQSVRTVLVFLSVLAVVSFFLKAVKAIPFWMSGGVGELKNAIIMDHALSINAFWDITFTYIGRPLQVVLNCYVIILIFQKKKEFLIYILFLLINILYFVASASKYSIFELVTFYFAYLFFFSADSLVSSLKKHKKETFLSLSILTFVLYVMSTTTEIINGFYLYLCGCIPCADNAISMMQGDTPFYGGVSLNGFLTMINAPRSYLGVFPEIKIYANECWDYMARFENTTMIGNDIDFNAFISMFSYFYADGGLYGVAIFSFLFGFWFQKINKKAFENPTYRSVALLLFGTYLISTMMTRSPLYLVPNVMATLYLYIFVPKESIKTFNC